MGFPRQEYWSGLLPCAPPGDLPDPGIEPMSPVSPALQADSLSLTTREVPAAAAAAAKSLQSCPTLRPNRRQPTRLPRPWDSPVFSPAERHGQRSLVGYIVHRLSKESDMTEET